MSKRVTTRQTTIEEHHLEVDKALLIEALRSFGYDSIPMQAQAFVYVPGGGDWSNTRLDIGEDGDIHVCWNETTHHDPVTEETPC
jgi:hypothetical protein